MRLLFVGKRHPQQRDLIERPYGRFHHLPAALAALGHEVRMHLCSHSHLPSTQRRSAGVEWTSDDVRTLGPRRVYRKFDQDARAFQPDWVIGVSDIYYGWLASQLAKNTGARLAIDAYDNYEAYMPWNVPLHALWRRSIRAADLVTAAGPQLAQKMQLHRTKGHPAEVLPMAADPEFMPMDKQGCRVALSLPTAVPLIGYVGGWAKNRGTDMLIDAFRRTRAIQPDLQLVLSGRPPKEVLEEPGVIATGYVPDAQLPMLINSLDIACVITAETSFGRYSYPAKLCEAMACEVPVVATATEPVRWMLGDRYEHLVAVGDAAIYAERILKLLMIPRAAYGPRSTWTAQAQRLNQLLTSVDRQKR